MLTNNLISNVIKRNYSTNQLCSHFMRGGDNRKLSTFTRKNLFILSSADYSSISTKGDSNRNKCLYKR